MHEVVVFDSDSLWTLYEKDGGEAENMVDYCIKTNSKAVSKDIHASHSTFM